MESPDGGLLAIDGSTEAESNEDAAESDPFAGSAEDHAANEKRGARSSYSNGLIAYST